VRWSRRGGGAALAAGLVGSAVVLSEGPPPGSAHWTFDWTAPATGGAVVFNLAANAANDDMTPNGDAIYIREFRVGRKH